MAYTFAAHMACLIPPQPEPGSVQDSFNVFALIDAAQLLPLKRSLQRLVPDARYSLVFEESFARSALELSPLLFELSTDPEMLVQQLAVLDAACQHRPVMSVIHTTLSLDELTRHLRGILLIEADGSAYLLRFADSQMLAATNSVITPNQRTCVMSPLRAWFAVDHQGRLNNAADVAAHSQAEPATPLPLVLDTLQTHALLAAAEVPTLASQVRHLDESFAQKLSHAQQTEFIVQCVNAARSTGIDDENALMSLTLQRWHAEQSRAA